jgi:DNA (cytosine-5)-methyltransferase 1
MRHGSLFSGIGGFDLAAEWMGWENVFHCEWMEFPRKVLDYHFPNADSHIDICKTDFKKYANKIDILTGGFPCQPFSLAGKRKGTDDERYLWGEMLRAIQEIKPKFIIAENVFGITNIDGGLVFQQVCLDLETEGYEVQPFIIPAAAKDAPHRRDRCWFIAYANGNDGRSTNRESGCEESKTNGEGEQPIHSRIGSTSNERDVTNSECIGLEHRNKAGNIRSEKTKTRRERGELTNEFEANDNASNTNGNGFNERNGNDEINTSQGGEYALGDISKSNGNGDVAYSNGIGCGRGNQQPKSNQSKERKICENEQQHRDGVWCEVEGCCWDATNPKCIGRTEIRNDNGQFKTPQQSKCREQQFSGTDSTQSWWRNFPSQSPVCGGDDGLPTQLDRITFSKWRAESIKGYGNAIVPQIAYQLFEIIQELNENN